MASLPDFLFDTHKRYKADTNRVAEWLAETAQKCGLKLETEPVASRPSGRLKGKARKEARIAAATAPSARHIVTVKEFTDMAQFIVQQKRAIRVPETILGFLRSAINLRQRCTDWFQRQSIEGDKSTDQHSHFIGVLEDVLQILEPISRPKARQKDVALSMEKLSLNATSQSPPEPCKNPYEILFAEEDSVTKPSPTLETRPNVQRTQATPAPPKMKYEMESTIEDMYFAIFCLFDDLNRLRKFLLDLWTQYKLGSCDLITASVTTNSAIELVHRAEKDLAASFPTIDTYDKAGGLFFELMCALRREESGKKVNKMGDVAEWVFLPVHSILNKIVPSLHAWGRAPRLCPCCQYDPSTDRSKLSFGDQMEADLIVLGEALDLFSLFTQFDGPFPVPDELLDGFRLLFTEKTVPTWVTFSAQIYLDIHHVLGQDIGRGFTELQRSGAEAISTLNEYFATSQTFYAWTSYDEAIVDNIRKFVDFWITHDPVAPLLPGFSGGHEWLIPEPHAIFRRNPLLSGLFQFRLYLAMQESAIPVANAWGSILFVSHLYEACRRGGYSNRIWPDMELIMDIHTREAIFAGRVPRDPDEAYKSSSLMLGLSPVMWAKNPRVPKFTMSKAPARGLVSNSPVITLLRGRYSGDPNTRLTFETVESLLQDCAVAPASATISSDRKFLRQQWTKSHKLTVLQLLETLRDSTAAEQYMLRLDYFALHKRCFLILRELRNSLDEEFLENFNSRDFVDDDTELMFMVPCLLMVTTGLAKVAKAAESLGLTVENPMMKKAGEVLDEVIGREGGVELEKLVNMRSVRVPTVPTSKTI
jgi:hypothetical protein